MKKYYIFIFLFTFVFGLCAYQDDYVVNKNVLCSKCHNQSEISRFCLVNKSCGICHSGTKKKSAFLSNEYFINFVKEKRNPHNSNYLCSVCHNSLNIKKAENELKLCLSCHDVSYVNLYGHSFGFIYKEKKDVKIPNDFHLKEGKVVCSTCHEFKCKNNFNNYKLLRKGYSRLEDYCFNCHKKEYFKKFNPHIQIDTNSKLITSTCTICHLKIPDIQTAKTKDDVKLKSENINEICNGCHQVSGFHPTGINHLIKPNNVIIARIKEFLSKENIYVPFGKDYQILCVTCHLPHQYELIPEQAAGKFERRTRFNKGKDLCIMCHNKI
ncbi:hypothetical protein OWM07_11010 [Deferribacter thermophilus]|uniref:hypothetical protein n=1 Tax=Deferribacter thermophilus TaxID=53573 RepID=UPI003C1A6849